MRCLTMIIGTLMFFVPPILQACGVCYGDSQSPMTAGLNQAIFLLLGVIGFILTMIVTVGIYFVRRNRLLGETGINS